jgi:hypothetical protein
MVIYYLAIVLPLTSTVARYPVNTQPNVEYIFFYICNRMPLLGHYTGILKTIRQEQIPYVDLSTTKKFLHIKTGSFLAKS